MFLKQGDVLLQNKIDSKLIFFFSVIPILSLVQIPNISYGPDLLRVLILLAFTLIIIILFHKEIKVENRLQIFPLLLLGIYVCNQLFLKNDITSFLLGKYNRFGGFITLICLTIYFIVTSNFGIKAKIIFINSLFVTYLLMILHGVLTFFGLLPSDTYFDANDKIVRSSYDLSLTFGNPNISSALMGIILSVHLVLLILKVKKNIIVQGAFFMLGLFILFETKSIQGWLILIFNLIFLLVILYRNQIFELNSKMKIIFLIFISTIFIGLLVNLRFIFRFLYRNANVEARLNYWNASIRIWQDFKFTGVGLDNLGEFSTYYRNLELAKQEGPWTIPDRSHNVILDHLVNGGIFAMIVWLGFIGIVTYLACKKLIRINGNSSPAYEVSVVLIWFGYLIQSLISVDHLFLTLLGYISAGFIVGSHFKLSTTEKRYSHKKTLPLLAIIGILLIFLLNQIVFSYNVNQFLKKGNTKVLDKLYNSRFIEQQSYLDTVVKLSGDKQFKLASLFANKLLLVNPYASQAYYANSVYFESEKNLVAAKKEMQLAHEYDKFNSVYTLSLGIYEYNLKNYSKARFWLDKTDTLDSNQQGIEILRNLLSQVKY